MKVQVLLPAPRKKSLLSTDKGDFFQRYPFLAKRVIYLRYDIALSCDDICLRHMRNGYYIMLAKQVYHTACRISYRVSDISLKYTTNCNIIMAKEGAFMSENKLLDLSFEFAVAIVNLVDGVTAPKSSYMADQLARAGTSVGANIHEAQYAQSKKDFVAKLEIALKESNETSYWLKLMYETKRIDIATYQYTEKLCGNIRRLLIASCRTAKESTK